MAENSSVCKGENWNQKLTSVVVQNVEESWPSLALTTYDRDVGTHSERLRQRL